jgi:hypothetical protein
MSVLDVKVHVVLLVFADVGEHCSTIANGLRRPEVSVYLIGVGRVEDIVKHNDLFSKLHRRLCTSQVRPPGVRAIRQGCGANCKVHSLGLEYGRAQVFLLHRRV